MDEDNRVENALEWFYFADADLDSAHILKGAHRQHNEIICYHCQQAAEKYLKGFLMAQNMVPPKTHILETLCALCSETDSTFNEIAKDCAYLSQFAVRVRYPYELEVTNFNVEKALSIADGVSKFAPIAVLREQLIASLDREENTK